MTKRLLSLLGILALLGINSNQAVTRGYIFTNIGTQFSWSGSAQAGWSGSVQAATCSDYTTFIHNDGTSCLPSNALVTYGFATTHAVNTSPVHTPILANNTFSGGSMSSWTSANTGSCTGSAFSPSSATDEDGDNGLVYGSSLGCSATAATITLAQSFSTGGTPTSQSYSFWYLAPTVTYGDPINCTQGSGTAALTFKINATVVVTPSIVQDGSWHQVTGTTTALVSGANSVTFTATLSGAAGQLSKYNARLGVYTCGASLTKPQPISIDNVVLTGTW